MKPERPAAEFDAPAGGEATGKPQNQPLPPATLTLLLTSLGTQALISFGQIPNPATGKAELERDHARHCIDMLAMLEEKTAGNRTAEESQLLDGMLYELRMLFVQTEK